MQPLISQVDHESRHGRLSEDDDSNDNLATEYTPLLPRFPIGDRRLPRRKTTLAVAVLLSLLFSGMIISIYLLVVQSNSENRLPPIDQMPILQLVTRAEWDPNSGYARPVLSMPPLTAEYVIMVQTDTRECSCYSDCIKLLQEIKVAGTKGFYDIPYNFMVSEYGESFEGLGWRSSSPLFTEFATTGIVIAVIGNYTHVPPTRLQMLQSVNLILESISQQHLDPGYKVFGKAVKYYPRYLFHSAQDMPHWADELTDESCYF